MNYLNEHHIFIFLIQIFLLLGLAKGLGVLFERRKQPPLTAEILVGVLLGPTILGRFFPHLWQTIFPADMVQKSMLETIAWLGVFFLLLESGLGIDFSVAWRQRGDALKIALVGVFVPILIGFVLCLFLPDRYLLQPDQRIIFSFFMATVMAISAITIATRVLHDLNLSKTDLGFLIMSAFSVNDIVGWMIFSLILSLITQGVVDIPKMMLIFLFACGFLVLCLTYGRHFTNAVISKIKEKQMPDPGTSLTFICLLGLLCGAITQKMGIHALFGFLIAGVMAGEAKALSERTRQIISQMVFAIFVPIFFASIGLRIDFIANFDLKIIIFITLLGIFGKYIGAWLGARWTNLSEDDRRFVAIAHTPGGTMEIVVGMITLEYRLISEPVFEAIVFGAVVSSSLVGPWLKYSLKRRKEVGAFEFFSRRAVIAELKAHKRDMAIEELCELACAQDNMPAKETIVHAVLERENIMGTAIEEGIAFPHARFSFLQRPVVVFGRSKAGIDWNSPDGENAHYIFLILTPMHDNQSQVQILGLIAKAMSDPRSRQAVLLAKESSEVWEQLQKTLSVVHMAKK
ncbi:MAG: cation:proton antiporter [Candidatus Omnitrophota bacterium]